MREGEREKEIERGFYREKEKERERFEKTTLRVFFVPFSSTTYLTLHERSAIQCFWNLDTDDQIAFQVPSRRCQRCGKDVECLFSEETSD